MDNDKKTKMGKDILQIFVKYNLNPDEAIELLHYVEVHCIMARGILNNKENTN